MQSETIIRTLTQALSRVTGAKASRISSRTLSHAAKKSRKRAIRYGLLGANLVILIAVIGFVIKSPDSGNAIRQSALSANGEDATNPLDQPSSSDIAVHLARMASLPESTAVVNQVDTINGQLAISSADSKVVDKPQIVSTATKSRFDIQRYVTAGGDILPSIAAKFGVTSDSIRWSNNITGNTLTPGKELFIPPVNGIIYVVKAGDTPDKLARDYNANKDSIIAFNDAEVNGLPIGQRIVIPDGTKASTAYNVYGGSNNGGSTAWGITPIYGFNGYDYGWCTWYSANKVSVPANWGNANTWDNYASRSGWTVSTVPRVGAIAQTDAGGLGHVGVVEAVSEDGRMIKYSDMNGLAGWGRVGYSEWVPALGKYQRFIYR